MAAPARPPDNAVDIISDRPIRNFERWRLLWEQVQMALTPTDWPADLAERLGLPLEVVVRRDEVRVDEPIGSASRLRIAFASDFHAGPTTPDAMLRNAAAALHAESPDLLLLGGDFVSLRARYVDRVLAHLRDVPAPAGRFAVLGNHDYWAGAREVVRALERAGIEVITNAARRLPPPFEQVSVSGLDDHMAGHPDAASALDGATGLRLVLMHQPSGLLDLGDRPFRVAFAGHTHGGQIALRSGYPLVVPWGPLSRRYSAGRFELGQGRELLVSRGVGCSTVPVRRHAPAEVHLCTLVSDPLPAAGRH
jgi:hypothetical protein